MFAFSVWHLASSVTKHPFQIPVKVMGLREKAVVASILVSKLHIIHNGCHPLWPDVTLYGTGAVWNVFVCIHISMCGLYQKPMVYGFLPICLPYKGLWTLFEWSITEAGGLLNYLRLDYHLLLWKSQLVSIWSLFGIQPSQLLWMCIFNE